MQLTVLPDVPRNDGKRANARPVKCMAACYAKQFLVNVAANADSRDERSLAAACAAANDASKLPHQLDHLVLLRARDLGEHRQRDDSPLIGMRVRELLGAMVEAAIGSEER